ncbi:PVC-type heme-binding CxxCH protein [Roseimaritima sediminicola]|uniref:PVC-type heme-binding CxxCH protein n=1 Tax=Roseimaritima sediminicola TaxID=2662066 RepID=UPI001386EF10|nr:PVC-type heme-binding CxxCH protein [Roseimaritima sediminicola]
MRYVESSSFRLWITGLGWLLLTSGVGAQEPAPAALPPLEAAATMRVPEGFEVTLFAGEPAVRQPIGFCLDDRARLWVAQADNYPVKTNESGDSIVILEDVDGDGRHDRRTLFYDGLNYVTGIEVGFGGVWVVSPPQLLFLPDRDGDDVPDGPPQVIRDGFGTHANAHNLANALAWGPDGWLYGTHGRTNWSMIGRPGDGDDQRTRFDGGVYRYHVVRDVWEAYADGTTNPWGIDWNDYGHAFVCNCVNPHLFQVIQGAHYEPWRGRASSQYAYERIDTIADHLHFVGIGNPRNGLGSAAEDGAGGGHAHCGTLIYLADAFPPRYRNQLFTNNIHGKRINNDLLRREGSGYVASHGPDFARSADPWFVGVTLAQGAAGEIFVSDWSDTGECHHTRNTQRQTGRIFRITYGDAAEREHDDLAALSSRQLADLHLHRNDWYVRHARRILQERAAAGQDLKAAYERLRKHLHDHSEVPRRLRALWTLHACDALQQETLIALLEADDENLRSWAVTLLCEQADAPEALAERLRLLAARDASPLVRLSLASALQRLPLEHRWPIATELARRGEDARDANLPLMIWYGVEPLIGEDLTRFVSLALQSQIPTVGRHIARRIADSDRAAEGVAMLVSRLTDRELDAAAQINLLDGLLAGLEGRRDVPLPAAWPEAYGRLLASEKAAVSERATRLGLRFGDPNVRRTLIGQATDVTASPRRRRQAIEVLAAARPTELEPALIAMLDDAELRTTALRALVHYPSPAVAKEILGRYSAWSAAEKSEALQTLATRLTWAETLVAAMEQGHIPAADLTAFAARQLRRLGDPALAGRVETLWGKLEPTTAQQARKIQHYKSWLTADVLADADLAHGRQLFQQHCGACHKFLGQGAELGPDLTGAQRRNLDYLLENLVSPSGAVSRDYLLHVVTTRDGRVLTGLFVRQDARSLTLRTINERIVVPVEEIDEHRVSSVSMMPDGLLEPLTDKQIRDLIGYLQQ